VSGTERSGTTSPFAPFRHRVFAAFWTGAFLSNIGTQMEAFAIGVYVTTRTGEAGWTGLVAAAAFVPSGLLGPVGGALADRFPRKTLLLTTTSIQTAFAALLTVLAATGSPSPTIVTLIVFASGCANAIGFPAYQSVLPDLVPREDLIGAVALSSAQWNLGRVLGPVLAGVVVGFGGYAWAFGINTFSFLAVIIAIMALRLPKPNPDGSSILRSIKQGLGYARRDPGLRVVVGYMLLTTFLAAPFIALVPYMSLEVLDAGKLGTSVLVATLGLGAVTMALSLGNLAARFGSRRVLVGSVWGLPGALAVYALMPNLALASVGLLFVAIMYFGALSSFLSIGQLRAPTEIRGRVVSILALILGTLYPLGSVLQGEVADVIGLRQTTLLAAGLMLVALFVLWARSPRFAYALDEPPAPLVAGPTDEPPDHGGREIPIPSADPHQ
jgi:MFS family permease